MSTGLASRSTNRFRLHLCLSQPASPWHRTHCLLHIVSLMPLAQRHEEDEATHDSFRNTHAYSHRSRFLYCQGLICMFAEKSTRLIERQKKTNRGHRRKPCAKWEKASFNVHPICGTRKRRWCNINDGVGHHRNLIADVMQFEHGCNSLGPDVLLPLSTQIRGSCASISLPQ